MIYTRIKCHHCDLSFGQEARFIEHLTTVHLVTDVLTEYLRLHHNSIHPTCTCSPECHESLKWGSWKKGFTSKFVRGHNAKLDSVFLKKEFQKPAGIFQAETFIMILKNLDCLTKGN